MQQRNISRILVIGDSYSDRGKFRDRRIGKLLEKWDLVHKSPFDRYSNSYIWLDYLAVSLITSFIIQRKKRLHLPINADDTRANIFNESLDHHKKIMYQSYEFIRSYTEGGMTCHNHTHDGLHNLFTRLVIEHLSTKIKEIEKDDKKSQLSAAEKAETLVIIGLGSNDLITANNPMDEHYDKHKIAKKAVMSLKKHMTTLIYLGYSNFMLVNTAGAHTAPFYIKLMEQLHKSERIDELNRLKNNLTSFEDFNDELEKMRHTLIKNHEHCHFHEFNLNKSFKEIYEHAESFHLNPDKRKQTYLDTLDEESLYWDEYHPGSEVHKIIAEQIEERIRKYFMIKSLDSIISHRLEKSFGLFKEKDESYTSSIGSSYSL